jgi:xanthine dehydrogenase accessory factor
VNFYKEIETIQAGNKQAVLCIIIQTKGSTPRKTGAKMIVQEDGSIIGTIGGGNLEQKAIQQALIQLKKGEADTYKYNLVKDLEMCCGGMVAIYYEPIKKMQKLYIFGAGHTGEALAKMATLVDFDITLFDDRKDYLDKIDIPNVHTHHIHFDKDLKKIKSDASTYVVIMTYSHDVDRQILSRFADKALAYLGMIGSQRKISVARKYLKGEQTATYAQIEAIDMPIGMDINAITPEEIAVSVLAKLIQIKNTKK